MTCEHADAIGPRCRSAVDPPRYQQEIPVMKGAVKDELYPEIYRWA